MRAALEWLYRASGFAAGFFLVLIAVLVVAQIVGRLAGIQVPAADDFARLSMAASAFLGLAFTQRSGGNVRVTLLIERLPARLRTPFEWLCLATASVLAVWFAWASAVLTWESYIYRDFIAGVIAFPKWIPMLGMLVGAVLLAIAFLDDLLRVSRGRAPSYREPSAFDQQEA
jgi:TRAP-type C4-dicarboxylate transport system permease small subunit